MSLVLSRKDQEITHLVVPPSDTETVITMQVVRHGERAQRHAWTAPRCVRIMRTELGPDTKPPTAILRKDELDD